RWCPARWCTRAPASRWRSPASPGPAAAARTSRSARRGWRGSAAGATRARRCSTSTATAMPCAGRRWPPRWRASGSCRSLQGIPRGPERRRGGGVRDSACAALKLVVLLLTMKLTDTQQAILGLIAERIEAEGVPPAQAEIARAFGFSGVRAAQYHLEALEAAGAIGRVPGRARGIRVLAQPAQVQPGLELPAANDNALHLPVLGQVAAGLPIGADIGSDQVVLMDRALFSPAPDYLLKVKGDSMIDEGIFEGDLIGVHRTSDARSG